MNREVYRRTWLRLHRSYEKRAFIIFRKAIKEAAGNIDFDNITESNYEFNVRFNVSRQSIEKAYYDMYLRIGLMHGERVGKGINKEMKRFEMSSFGDAFRRMLVEWLLRNAGTRITSVRETLVDYLIKEIQKGIEDGKTIRDVASEMQKLVRSRNFFRWQALRIARTESTAAANYGATVAGDDSGLYLEKVWISSHDGRTRRRPDDKHDHYVMEGVRVDKDKPFDVQGDFMEFPGDPKGNAANVINCRCTVALRGKRDAQGRLIFRP